LFGAREVGNRSATNTTTSGLRRGLPGGKAFTMQRRGLKPSNSGPGRNGRQHPKYEEKGMIRGEPEEVVGCGVSGPP